MCARPWTDDSAMLPRVWVFTVFHNEEAMLPYFLRHYGRFAEKIILWDDRSTDASRQIIARYPCAEARDLGWEGGFDDLYLVEFANQAYKEARGKADWCIWVDADEFVYHPDVLGELQRYQAEGATFLDFDGFQMFGDAPPSGDGQIYAELYHGQPGYYKAGSVFSPELLEMNWSVGKHTCRPVGRLLAGKDCEFVLLHYRYLGLDYLLKRNASTYSRMSARNTALQLGYHVYPNHWKTIEREFTEGRKNIINIFRPASFGSNGRPPVRPTSETLLALLLRADDISTALADYAAWLDNDLLALVVAIARVAHARGKPELAGGLEALADCLAGALAPH